MRSGNGTHYYLNSDVYEGPWDNDRRGGKNRGRIKFKNGSSIDARFIGDKADGDVEFVDREQNVFLSETEKNDRKKHGTTGTTGTTDFGSFQNGRLFGLGSITFSNGDVFKGHFKDGRACGKGVLKYVRSLPGIGGAEYEEATYDGDFKAGKREGFGVMTWSDGSSFHGVWKNDMRHEGEMTMANGMCYRGGFKDDKFSGSGLLLMQGRDHLIF